MTGGQGLRAVHVHRRPVDAQLASQILIVLAYRYASAEKVGPFIYSVIAFTAVLDWIVWDQVPSATTYLGMLLVIGGGMVAVRARRAATIPEEAPR